MRGDTTGASHVVLPRLVGIEVELLALRPRVRFLAAELPAGMGIAREVGWQFPWGCEFQSPPGFGREFEDLLARALHVIVEASYSATRVGGTHVHVDVGDFGPRELEELEAKAGAFCEVMLSAGAPHRRDRSLLPSMTDLLGVPWRLHPTLPTAEFRMFEACTDPDRVLGWAARCQALVEGVKPSERLAAVSR